MRGTRENIIQITLYYSRFLNALSTVLLFYFSHYTLTWNNKIHLSCKPALLTSHLEVNKASETRGETTQRSPVALDAP